ncbi:MAG: hypothetical protein CME85_01075 [Henriciella sp.]|jgi:uncharacterized membrane protein YoaT (DUF817 family)|uniref:DUF817 domain-containing protein n=1 Tax=Henriciella sp. TaxID=1968823 RepID=UPI000C1181E7|nr:DUF817 domain-containing protein [Henriciella sp.]MAN72756.1 hypothetical protein [Henriciella sp.]MBK74068.1 hypothetical protein [Henriciella sp.]PHR81581.1 MAG: hypothetical protein COA64_02595 [Henriciella sp.]|tara:strand:- start:463 stop:1344 length:882 start_codon:yes stop_codon:yes gene_type:complete
MWTWTQWQDWLSARRERIRQRLVRGAWSTALFEFLSFGIKQGWACIFGGLLLALMLGTHLYYPEDAWLSRYDFLVIAAVLIQIVLIATGLESLEEARVILAFHIVGTIMELFKTHAGSWVYPEDSFLRIGGVPLYSGFMYAAVGSYLARVWRLFDFRFDRFPPLWLQALLAAAIYLNFFTHHFTLDIRNGLFAATVLIYGRCVVWFRPDRAYRPMPLIIGFGLVALFIWFAENIGTLARAWSYPGQESAWKLVSPAKFGSWYLLMIISFVLVALIHRHRKGQDAEQPADREPG